MKFYWGLVRILWHLLVCPQGRQAVRDDTVAITHNHAGRMFECTCGYAVIETFGGTPVTDLSRADVLRTVAAQRASGLKLTLTIWGDGRPHDDDRPEVTHLWVRHPDRPLADFRREQVLCDALGGTEHGRPWWWWLNASEANGAAITTDEDEVDCTDCLGWLHA